MMCTGAIVQSRIKRVVIGAPDSRWPGMTHLLEAFTYNHTIQIDFSTLGTKCAMLLSAYFKKKRKH
jgi:tRNA(adenine34) deaminase